jgi:SpoVK/Ycf46/Vps4 family AAA+-type ATPase
MLDAAHSRSLVMKVISICLPSTSTKATTRRKCHGPVARGAELPDAPTANNVEVLPPELLRKGRFDEIFFVDLPNAAERESIFRIHLAKRGRPPKNYNIPALAQGADGFSGAEIEEGIISALFDAYADRVELANEHIARSLKETVPLSRLMEREINDRRQWAKGRTRPAS